MFLAEELCTYGHSNHDQIDRRAFAALLPALIASAALAPEAHAQQTALSAQTWTTQYTASPRPASGAPAAGPLPELVSGVYTPSESSGTSPGRKSRHYLIGMLKAGNIRLEMHETHQEAGAVHEATGKHLHSEIWYVKRGRLAN